MHLYPLAFIVYYSVNFTLPSQYRSNPKVIFCTLHTIQLHDAGYGYFDNVTLVSGRDDYDPGWNGNWPDRDNRRKDADDSWDRSDNQKGEQDKDNCKRHVFVDFQYRKRNCICITKHKILILCTVLSYKIQDIIVYVTVIHNRLLQWCRIMFEILILFQFYDMPSCIAHYKVFIETLNRIRYSIRYVSHDCLNLCSAKFS